VAVRVIRKVNSVPDEESWMIWTGTVREIIAAEACEQNELEPGVKKNTRGRPVKIDIVIKRPFYL
jgi:hypothetical protein